MRDVEQSLRYRKRSNRLVGHDYRAPGCYFITICAEIRRPWLGNVVDGQMVVNDVGRMVRSGWRSLPENCPGVGLDAFVVMPDHVHGVIMLGTEPHVVDVVTLGDVVKRFKGITTTSYAQRARTGEWERFDRRLWQQRYFDRVVRNDRDLERIRNYIWTNPDRWEMNRSTDK